MSSLDEPFSGLLVDASHGYGKRGDQHEASCFILTTVRGRTPAKQAVRRLPGSTG
jgi:hypothetical protein